MIGASILLNKTSYDSSFRQNSTYLFTENNSSISISSSSSNNSNNNSNKKNKLEPAAKNHFLIELMLFLHRLSRLERLAVYVSFFALVLLILYSMSKCYKHILIIKTRHNKYGFYLSEKYERSLATQMYRLMLFAKNNFSRHKNNCKNKTTTSKQKKKQLPHANTNEEKRKFIVISTKTPFLHLDTGHFNEMFEHDSKSNSVCDIPSLVVTENDDTVDERKSLRDSHENVSLGSENYNFIKAYLTGRRLNSFSYKQLAKRGKSGKPEIGRATSMDAEQRKKSTSLFLTSSKSKSKDNTHSSSNEEVRSSSPSLFKSYSSIVKIFKSKSSTLSSSSSSHLTTTTTTATPSDAHSLLNYSLPMILITDTSSMHTSIIDLDTFEPDEAQKFNSSQSLLKYYFEERLAGHS